MTFLTIYCLGFIGLAAFGLIPARIWSLLKYVYHITKESKSRYIIIASILILSTPIILYEIEVSRMISDCVVWSKCGPNCGNRWAFLSFLGIAYVFIEILFFAVRVRHKKHLNFSKNPPP